MMIRTGLRTVVCSLGLAVATLPAQAITVANPYLGPTAYRSANDSPFSALSFNVFHLEDFEDGLLNTPGVVTTTPGRINGPGDLADSVDSDDGAIDGSGAGGRSLLSDNFTTFAFEFDAQVLGALPTHVGVVWTDVGNTTSSPGVGSVEFEAFDALGLSLGVLLAENLGNGSADGRSNATDEDRFFGAALAGGMSRIEIRMPTSADWELDHLQYGIAAVPLPAAAWLFVTALGGLGWVSGRAARA